MTPPGPPLRQSTKPPKVERPLPAPEVPITAEFSFPAPAAVLSCNVSNGLHFQVKRKWVAAWRTVAAEAARAQLDDSLMGYRVRIQLVLPVRGRRRRDPHNFLASVGKVVADSVTDSGLVWVDDHHIWCEAVEPVLDQQATEVTVRLSTTGPCAEVCCSC